MSRFAVLLVLPVERLGGAVGIEHQAVPFFQLRPAHLVVPIRHDPEHQAGAVEPRHAAASDEQGRIVSSVDVGHIPGFWIQLRIEERDQAIRRNVRVKVLVELRDQLCPAKRCGQERPETRLQQRHQKGRGDSLARDVCHHEPDAAVAQLDEIEVVPTDGVGRAHH